MKTILLVAADKRNHDALMRVLSRGYRVIHRTDGSSALSVISAGAVDLVIADYRLADISTIDFFAALKARNAYRIPVILLSDYASISDYLTAFSLGAFEFLFQPINPFEILRIARAAMSIGTEAGNYSLFRVQENQESASSAL